MSIKKGAKVIFIKDNRPLFGLVLNVSNGVAEILAGLRTGNAFVPVGQVAFRDDVVGLVEMLNMSDEQVRKAIGY